MTIIDEISPKMDALYNLEKDFVLSEQTETEIKFVNNNLVTIVNQHIPIKRPIELHSAFEIIQGLEDKLRDSDLELLKKTNITLSRIVERYQDELNEF